MQSIVRVLLALVAAAAAIAVLFGADINLIKALAVGLLCCSAAHIT